MGLGQSKTFDAITSNCFSIKVGEGHWSPLPQLPDLGRIAATAQAVGNRVFLFGGYSVNANGDEHTSPNVNIFDIASLRWIRGADIPVPVDDSVSAVYQNRFIFLISGWSETRNVSSVQVYDTDADRWSQATPVIGAPVFGHFGGIAGNSLFYFDGVSDSGRKFGMSNSCWKGEISLQDHNAVRWSKLPPHPGPPRYRSACSTDRTRKGVLIVGGTDNPYNYNGIGYNGVPSNPASNVLIWDIDSSTWNVAGDSEVNMDLRGLLTLDTTYATIGGMQFGQIVSSRAMELPAPPVKI
jgi:hypothetical protein